MHNQSQIGSQAKVSPLLVSFLKISASPIVEVSGIQLPIILAHPRITPCHQLRLTLLCGWSLPILSALATEPWLSGLTYFLPVGIYQTSDLVFSLQFPIQ